MRADVKKKGNHALVNEDNKIEQLPLNHKTKPSNPFEARSASSS